jgi:hypothetical protein
VVSNDKKKEVHAIEVIHHEEEERRDISEKEEEGRDIAANESGHPKVEAKSNAGGQSNDQS